MTLGLRPERIRLVPLAEGWAARVDLVEPTGLGTVVHLDLGGQHLKLFTTDRPSIKVGEQVGLRAAPGDICLFEPASGLRLRRPVEA